MIRKRTFYTHRVADVFHQDRFFPAGSYSFTPPEGCVYIEAFLVGGGGGASRCAGGAGYTSTYRGTGYSGSNGEWVGTYSNGRNGDRIQVTPGVSISISVGAGAPGFEFEGYGSNDGGDSSISVNGVSYVAKGGEGGYSYGSQTEPVNTSSGWAGDGGSGACASHSSSGGSDGSDGDDGQDREGNNYPGGSGQGHTTRDFGEPHGKRNAGGGGGQVAGVLNKPQSTGGATDYSDGSGSDGVNITSDGYFGLGGGGYGGGGGATRGWKGNGGDGGDGTVLIRYYAYK